MADMCRAKTPDREGWYCSLRQGHAGMHRNYKNHELGNKLNVTWPNSDGPHVGVKPKARSLASRMIR